MKLQTGLDDPRVVVHQQRMRRDIIADMIESVFTHMPVAVHQQLTVVALRQRVFRNPLVRQGVVIISDIYG